MRLYGCKLVSRGGGLRVCDVNRLFCEKDMTCASYACSRNHIRSHIRSCGSTNCRWINRTASWKASGNVYGMIQETSVAHYSVWLNTDASSTFIVVNHTAQCPLSTEATVTLLIDASSWAYTYNRHKLGLDHSNSRFESIRFVMRIDSNRFV